jgi:large subunit ribosomal protein L32
MAVPKRKTSKARRDKRRAQHGIEAPRLSVCPHCHQPKRSH